MFQYTIKRLLLMVVTLFGIMVLTFVLTRLTPGDPAALRIGGGGAGPATAQAGAFEDMLELNRRNLGLDKPLIVNLEFADRYELAKRAIDDFFRPAEYWQETAERQLLRQGAIALQPALQRYALIGSEDEPVPMRDGQAVALRPAEQRRADLAELIPQLAGRGTSLPDGIDSETIDEHYQSWFKEHEEEFTSREVRAAVGAWVEQGNQAAFAQLGRAGGYAIPYLIGALETENTEEFLRANRALRRQTGLAFLTSETDIAPLMERARAQWRSWYRREKMLFAEQPPLRQALNVLADTQFGLWMVQAATLDFGDSYAERRPVIDLIKEALPVSLVISGISIFLSYLLAIPLGILSAIKRATPTDRLITIALFVLYSLPNFWVAGLLILTTTGDPFLDLFPARGLFSENKHFGAEGVSFFQSAANAAWHLVLPVLCLTYSSLAFISRQMRSAMLEVITQDYIRTAQAKGLSTRRVILKHALRNSLIPIITISAGLLPELIAGAVIIESIFTIPGMGTLTLEAIVNRDYPIINAVLLFSAFLTLLGILIADLSYAVADPRITYD